MKIDELKPCPFCGSEPILSPIVRDNSVWCSNIDCFLNELEHPPTSDEWNVRSEMSNELMWWGYLHPNGSIQVKRWFGYHKYYTEYCEGNEFVKQVVKPFAADSREQAEEIIKRSIHY